MLALLTRAYLGNTESKVANSPWISAEHTMHKQSTNMILNRGRKLENPEQSEKFHNDRNFTNYKSLRSQIHQFIVMVTNRRVY